MFPALRRSLFKAIVSFVGTIVFISFSCLYQTRSTYLSQNVSWLTEVLNKHRTFLAERFALICLFIFTHCVRWIKTKAQKSTMIANIVFGSLRTKKLHVRISRSIFFFSSFHFVNARGYVSRSCGVGVESVYEKRDNLQHFIQVIRIER